jgi:hypothetical protein
MKLYNRISLCFSALFLLLCLGTLRWAQLYGSAIHDGGGPDPLAVLALILMWPAGIALVHSTLIAAVLLAGGKRRAREAKESLVGNGILWLLIIAVWAWPRLNTAYDHAQYDRLETSKTFAAIQEGSLADFEKHYAKAQAEHPYEGFANSVKTDAELASRLDIMKSLKDKGMAFAAAGNEDGWINSVGYVVRSESADPRTRLEAVRWLLAEGAPFGYSLRRKSEVFSNPELYWKAYKDLSNPITRQLLDLLMAHGADINACEGGKSCPLWFMARFGKTDAVRYLLSHGAQVDRADTADGSTALSQAIQDGNPATVKVLLDAGATIADNEHRSDIVLACDMLTRIKNDDIRQVLQLLRGAQARAAQDRQEKYTGGRSVSDPEEAECVKSFM